MTRFYYTHAHYNKKDNYNNLILQMKIPLKKKKKKCYKKNKFVWTQDLNHTLIIIENDNPLSTIKEITIAFQAKHPNLDLTFEIFTIEKKT